MPYLSSPTPYWGTTKRVVLAALAAGLLVHPWSSASGAVRPGFSPPQPPRNVHMGIHKSLQAQVRWSSAPGGVDHYVVSVSRDNAATWTNHTVSAATLQYFVPELVAPAQAALVRIASVKSQVQSDWSTPVVVTTTGTKTMGVQVVDAQGTPVIGGQITWHMRDVNVRSSKTYGLTNAGHIDFPAAPAGWVVVDITDAQRAIGDLVTGTFTAVLGFTTNTLTLPDAPSPVHTITVRLPGENGYIPVPNATVDWANDEGLYTDADCQEWALGTQGPEDTCTSYGSPSIPGGGPGSDSIGGPGDTDHPELADFTFRVTTPQAPLVSDAQGRVSLPGYIDLADGQPMYHIRYDAGDGSGPQGKDIVMRSADVSVVLDPMPYLSVDAAAVTGDLGTLLPVDITVAPAADEGVSSQSRSAQRMTRSSSVAVSMLLGGAPEGSCAGRRLTGSAGVSGVVHLKVCATESGVYHFTAHGAAAVASVLLRVQGARSLPPRLPAAISRVVGTARVSWVVPAYTGGAAFPVTGYRITARAKGLPTVVASAGAKDNFITLTGLANARTYTVSIQARTSVGLSDPATTMVPVA